MAVTPSGTFSSVSDSVDENAECSMVLSVKGRLTVVRLVHHENSELGITVMPSPIVALTSFSQLEKAPLNSVVTLPGMVTSVN